MANMPRTIRSAADDIRNMNRVLLSFHERFLNFSANKGISVTSIIDNMMATAAIRNGLDIMLSRVCWFTNGNSINF